MERRILDIIVSGGTRIKCPAKDCKARTQFRVLELNVSEHQRRSCQYNAINSAFYRQPPSSPLHWTLPSTPFAHHHHDTPYEEVKYLAKPVRLQALIVPTFHLVEPMHMTYPSIGQSIPFREEMSC